MRILSYGALQVENEIYKEKINIPELRKRTFLWWSGSVSKYDRRNLLEREKHLMKKMSEQLLRLSTAKMVKIVKRVSRFAIRCWKEVGLPVVKSSLTPIGLTVYNPPVHVAKEIVTPLLKNKPKVTAETQESFTRRMSRLLLNLEE